MRLPIVLDKENGLLSVNTYRQLKMEDFALITPWSKWSSVWTMKTAAQNPLLATAQLSSNSDPVFQSVYLGDALGVICLMQIYCAVLKCKL